jgi:predicted secreted hydrolase
VIVPSECEQGPDTVRSALRSAPGEVRLEGRVKISDCFQQAADAASVQNLGSTFLATAQQLADRVRDHPHSDAAVQLGYLIGALRRGAGTRMGVHYEAVRRVQQELAGLDVNTPEFRRGLEAGRSEG